MDADDDEPLGRGIPAGQEPQPIAEPTTSGSQTDSHPTEGDSLPRPPNAAPATATDLALEQDA